MGFRSTFTTDDYNIAWPAWFREKYRGVIWFAGDGRGPLHSVRAAKTYKQWESLHLLTTFAGIIDTFRRAAIAFAESMRPLQAMFVRFDEAVYTTIDRAYVEAHPGKRLPKPTKTRWRKKRRKIVLAWFERCVERG